MNLNNHGIPTLLYYLHLDTTASIQFAHTGLEILEVILCALSLTATGIFVGSIQPAYECRYCVSSSAVPCIIDDPDFRSYQGYRLYRIESYF